MRLLFLDRHTRELYRRWDEEAAFGGSSSLRYTAAQHREDRALAELIGQLSMNSPEFARAVGEARRARLCSSGTKHLHHPEVGDLELDFEALAPARYRDGQRLLTYTGEALALLGTIHCTPVRLRRSVGPWAIEPSPALCARRCLEPVAATSEITPRAARRLRKSAPRQAAADAADRTRVRAAAGRATRQHRRPGPLGDGRLPRRPGLVRRGRRRRHRAAAADDHAHRDGVRQRDQDGHRRARAAPRRAGRARARRSRSAAGIRRGAATGRRRCATCWAIPRGPADPTQERVEAILRHPRGDLARRFVAASPKPGPRTSDAVYSNTGFVDRGADPRARLRRAARGRHAARAVRPSGRRGPRAAARRASTRAARARRTGTPTAGPSRPTPRTAARTSRTQVAAELAAAARCAGRRRAVARALGARPARGPDPGPAVAARR